jgi:lysophospholipase L1-like esterase
MLLLGANDACLPTSPSKQHVPLENYRQNLRTILDHPTLKSHNAKILLVTPPPIHEVHLQAEDLRKGASQLTREQKVTSQYAQVVRDVAAEYANQDVVLVDLNKAILEEAVCRTPGNFVGDHSTLGTLGAGDSEGFRELLVDGLHLTGAGYKVFLDAVIPHVGKEWADEPFDNPTSWIFP